MANYTTTILASLQTTITTITTIIPIITNFSNFTNYTNSTNHNSEAAYNNNPPQTDPATLATPYIALIISVIGLFSTIIVHYNIKKIKICCIKFECMKNKNIKHNTNDSNNDNDDNNDNDNIYDTNFDNIQIQYLDTHHPQRDSHPHHENCHPQRDSHPQQDNSGNNNEKFINDTVNRILTNIFNETIV